MNIDTAVGCSIITRNTSAYFADLDIYFGSRSVTATF